MPAPVLPGVQGQVVLGVRLVLLPVLGDLGTGGWEKWIRPGRELTCQIVLFFSSIAPNSRSWARFSTFRVVLGIKQGLKYRVVELKG